MAARKLKFKPKPSVNVLNIRRARDTDEAANLSQEKVTEKEEVVQNQQQVVEQSESVKLKIENGINCEASDAINKPILVVIHPTISESKLSEDSIAVDSVNLDCNLISSQQSGNANEVVRVTEESVALGPITVVDNSVGVTSIVPEVVDSDDKPQTNSNKAGPSVAKGLSRFGRSRYKPVLSNPDLRKKSDAGTSSEVIQAKVEAVEAEPTENSEGTTKSTIGEQAEVHTLEENCTTTISKINQMNNQRTESVIKSVQSELSKTNPIVQEITESFTLLESTDEELTQILNLDSSKNVNDNLPSINDHDAENTSLSDVDSSENSYEPVPRSRLKPLNASNKVPVSPGRSMSKVLVPKPSPRITEISPRRISFQGSDSEEEIYKKKKSYRKKENSTYSNEAGDKNSQTNKRKRSQGSTYSKMSQETLDKFSKKFGKSEVPDKTKLTMIDLIFYNPKNNPMPQSSQDKPKKKEKTMEINEIILDKIEEEKVDDVEPAAIPVPQLKIGPDGQIILDPQSLVIETTGTEKGREKLEKSEVVQDTGITRYSTYRKKKPNRGEWSRQETLQFFRALNTVGSDFTLMTQLFPNRSRHELKLKFKREEKANLRLVDKAMTEKVDFDFNSLQEDFQQENDRIFRKNMEKKLAAEAAQKERAIKKEEMLKNKEKKKQIPSKNIRPVKAKTLKEFNDTEQKLKSIKKKQNGHKKLKPNVLKKESGDSGVEEQIHIDFDSSSDDEEDAGILNVVKQTRFGRYPKRTSKLEEYEEINETLKKKLQRESDMEEDGYVPNGRDAQMLFGTPLREGSPAELEDNELMDFQIANLPTIEETVLREENFTDVSEISELGSFGQNDGALDLTLPVRTSVETLYSQRPDIDPLLDSQMIAQSFQIVDQLTSNVQSSEDFCENKKNIRLLESGNHREVQTEMKMPLPSFESVSHARPSMMYSVETNHTPMQFNAQNTVTVDDSSSQGNRLLINFYNSTEDYAQEVIIGE